jgi:hypothetical protein
VDTQIPRYPEMLDMRYYIDETLIVLIDQAAASLMASSNVVTRCVIVDITLVKLMGVTRLKVVVSVVFMIWPSVMVAR